jgi:hypothetical protein
MIDAPLLGQAFVIAVLLVSWAAPKAAHEGFAEGRGFIIAAILSVAIVAIVFGSRLIWGAAP